MATSPLMSRLQDRRSSWTIAPFVAAVVVFAALEAVPSSGLPDRALVLLEAARVVLGMLLLLYYLGWSVGDFVLPLEWKGYEPLLLPLLGIVVLVPVSYLLNYLVGLREATAIMVILALPLAARRFLHGTPVAPWTREMAVPAIAAILLLFVALMPHLIQSSLGLLGQNSDEEVYFYLAKYLMVYPTGASMPGPLAPLLDLGSSARRAEGYGYQNLLAVASATSSVDTFDAYLPSTYLILALGVVGWHLFFKETLGLRGRASDTATILYSICGLPLWLAAYGYAKQTAWIALTPLAMGAIVLVVRGAGPRVIALCSLVVGTLLCIETRVVSIQVAVSAVGLVVCWLLLDRRWPAVRRLTVAAGGAALVAAPPLWYLVQGLVVSGQGTTSLEEMLIGWGPGFSGFPPIEAGLSLEPNELARIAEPIAALSWLDPLNVAMSALAPILAYILVGIAAIGAIQVAKRNPIVVAITGSLVAWLIAMRVVLPFPYGYFKIFGVLGPLILGLAIVGLSWMWYQSAGFRTNRSRAARAAVFFTCALVAIFFVRNSSYSFLFGARGWGLSIPPSLVNTIASFGAATEPGSRVYLTGSEYYPVPQSWILLRKDNRGAITSHEEASVIWGTRLRTLAASSLVGRAPHGVFKTEWFGFQSLLPDDNYDYYILWGDEDPRLRGLDSADAVVAGQGITLYKNPRAARASSGQILSERGSLSVDEKAPLVVLAGPEGLQLAPTATTTEAPQEGTASGRIRVGLMALVDTTVDVSIGDRHQSLLLDSGVSWYTTPNVALPSTLRVEATGGDSVKVVSLRLLPPGDEGLDRSSDVILLSEMTPNQEGVDMELWLSNPAREMDGTSDPRANLQVPGPPPTERTLALRVPDAASKWLLRFGHGGELQQLRNGIETVPIAPFQWLPDGGLLSIWFRLGHQRQVKVPLAIAGGTGQQSNLLRLADPAQVRLWIQGEPANRAATVDMAALEGKRVRSNSGFEYIVSGGRRHWIPDPQNSGSQPGATLLSPEQLWAVPPGLPVTP